MSSLKIKERVDQKMDFDYETFEDLPIYEQRYMPRWETSKKAFYRAKNTFEIVGTRLRNLSLGGASIYVGGNVHINEILNVNIYLDAHVSFKAKARVMWRVYDRHNSYVGVCFEHIDESVQEKISTYAFGLEPGLIV